MIAIKTLDSKKLKDKLLLRRGCGGQTNIKLKIKNFHTSLYERKLRQFDIVGVICFWFN